jgi:hypothetical protein
MASSSSSTIAGEKKDETTGPANSTYNILIARNANRSDLVNMWKIIEQNRQKHLQMLREALEKEAKQEKLT